MSRELSTTGIAGSMLDEEELEEEEESIRRNNSSEELSLNWVRREEIESKIFAWQVAKMAKIDNRFTRKKMIINGRENERVEKAASWFKKIERELEKQRARAEEKMENEVARARRKADERRAEAEAERAAKVARVLEMAKIMRAFGRAPCRGILF